MNLNIDNPETERLAQLLASETGEPIDIAVIHALRDRLESVLRRKQHAKLKKPINHGKKMPGSSPGRT